MDLETYIELELKKISGIGDVSAKELRIALMKMHPNLTLKADIRALLINSNLKLNVLSKADLKYNPVKRIKHDIITNLFASLKANHTLPKSAVLAGSYRRGKSYSSDIDILIKNQEQIRLKKDVPRNEALLLEPFAHGEKKWTSMIGYMGRYFKADIYFCGDSLATMLLYLTGSYEFNIWIRTEALKNGFFLNQNGLYKKKDGKKVLQKTKTEQDIFKKLGIKYIKPENREPEYLIKTLGK